MFHKPTESREVLPPPPELERALFPATRRWRTTLLLAFLAVAVVATVVAVGRWWAARRSRPLAVVVEVPILMDRHPHTERLAGLVGEALDGALAPLGEVVVAPGHSSPSHSVETRVRTWHGLRPEVIVTIRAHGDGREQWGWTWTLSGEGDDFESEARSTTDRIGGAVRDAISGLE